MASLQWFFLLALSFAPTLAEVVGSLADCSQFLLDDTPPQIPGVVEGGRIQNQNRYKPICQTYRNTRRFLTLYDVQKRIPVFSAYRYRGVKEAGRPKKHWMVEPQLENEGANKTMTGRDNRQHYIYQAIDTDFRSNGTFDRGHLFPSSHALTREHKRATFTLTNIVPQAGSFNQGSWSRMETCVKCVMDGYCVNGSGAVESFVVTGARPSTNKTLNNRVNIPTMLWSAFCCHSSKTQAWMASAYWRDNVPDSRGREYLQPGTLAQLQERLRTADSEFQVFPGTDCPLNATVRQFYPQMKNCQCEPSASKSDTSTPASGTASFISPVSLLSSFLSLLCIGIQYRPLSL
ncbi:endonuclease domain-containing 1 protein-like [Salarias fasciatus]|uniref:Endonuclease domain-containing 1 protein-like n=1 Tax=Salarias fasciatus TaxID=181472 RepID=A0A672HJ83_SALFA|nr:endonuclease domain-containing 1 protein-like [Salarias fasciatus]XP_029938739.1 endonuclease domain-containing 1 protein-like [Salarias fasciatus]XP_029938749.1 endonuclease domain-containing 1 protein-like [Salarias fasciatus]XP_029938759.1 endonuclease domain-containing 1 protein-like [Salarias fasciatus]XP_029938768.1 endonuclease domain-containing 1 protein-like [Salarias fasciatus]